MGDASLSNSNPGISEPQLLRLLIVEDNLDDLELCLRVLRRAGFSPKYDVAGNPEDFIHLLQNCTYDVVLSDYQLGNWTGLHALELFLKRQTGIPFILLTGALGEDLASEV